MIRAYLAVEQAFAWAAALALAATGFFLSWEVVSRYFFNAPTIWAAEISQLCLIWACPLAMAWALSARRHIRVDAITRLLPEPAQRAAEIISLLCILAFAAVTTVFGYEIFHDSLIRGRTAGTMLDPPAWIPELSIPFGFGLLCLSCLVNIARVARGDALGDDGARDGEIME